jgi:hypothetical protein
MAAVKTESLKSGSIALVCPFGEIYFCSKLIDEDSPSNRPMSLNRPEKFNFYYPLKTNENPVSINFFILSCTKLII